MKEGIFIKREKLKLIILFIFIFILTFFIVKYKSVIFNININNTRNFILKYGKFSSLIYVIIYSLKPVLIIAPSSVLSIMAGTVFGKGQAFVLNMISSYFAATLAFYIARILGKSYVDKILKNKALKIDEKILINGFIIILLMRLSVIFAYDALSYACGLTKMKYKDFIAGTMLGIIPETLTYSYMGESINKPFSIKIIIPILLTIIIAVTSYFLYKKFSNTHKSRE